MRCFIWLLFEIGVEIIFSTPAFSRFCLGRYVKQKVADGPWYVGKMCIFAKYSLEKVRETPHYSSEKVYRFTKYSSEKV